MIGEVLARLGAQLDTITDLRVHNVVVIREHYDDIPF
jgi:hypothetical protein